MARTVHDTVLDSRSARLRLPESKKHWRPIEMTLHIGYRRGPRGGTWYGRRYAQGKYVETTLGASDDRTDADGSTILGYKHALEALRTWWQSSERQALGLPDSSSGPYTVSQACDDYLAHYVAKGGKAEYSVRRTVEVHVRPSLGSHEVEKLSTRKIRDWHHALATAPKILRTKLGAARQATRSIDTSDVDAVRSRRATANRVLTVLKAVLNHAWHEREVDSDAEWRPVKPFGKADAAVVRYLTGPECLRLVNSCPPDLRRIVQGALLTGARYGELCRLKVGDVDIDAGVATIRQSKGGRPRHAVLTDEARRVFADLTAGRAREALVFTHDNGSPWKPAQQTRPLLEACRRIGLTPAIGFHVLRHTHASTLAMAGVPLAVIAQQLGHADTRITGKHYAHLAPSYVADTIRSSFPAIGLTFQSNVAEMKNRETRNVRPISKQSLPMARSSRTDSAVQCDRDE